jgi:hypothetical protein
MRGVWLLAAIGLMGAIGCNSTPKRELRQATASEELVTPPADMYNAPREVPRDQSVLMPKTSGPPGLNTGMPGAGGPQMGPGGAGSPVGGARR